jgi:ribosome biogenesis GTPase / thiamine phosphate phosphatase
VRWDAGACAALVATPEDVTMYELSTLGFGPFFEQQIHAGDDREVILARIAAEHRGAYEVWSPAGAGLAQLSGRLRLELDETGLPGVGDFVVLKDPPSPEHATLIERVLERRTVFTRGAASHQARAQVVAANIDLVFAVCGLDADFNVHRLERYLARIWASDAVPVIVLNKADLCDGIAARLAEVERRCPGVTVRVTSALHGEGIAALRDCIEHGMTAAFVGSSGAGKSTLVNALLGEEHMATGAVRARDGRGCHVTTHRQLVLLPGGGLLLDTPGMRELQLVDDYGLEAVFADVAALAGRCRFRDCHHDSEPGCAVKAAVAAGDLAPDRLEHFRTLAREALAYERRHDERLRRQAERAWGQLHDEVAQLRRWKGGKP